MKSLIIKVLSGKGLKDNLAAPSLPVLLVPVFSSFLPLFSYNLVPEKQKALCRRPIATTARNSLPAKTPGTRLGSSLQDRPGVLGSHILELMVTLWQ